MNILWVSLNHPLTLTLIGMAGTWFFAWFYYKRAGDELRDEAKELKRLNEMVLRGLEEANFVTLRCNGNGTIIGFKFNASITESATLSDSFSAEVRRHQSDKGIEGNPCD
jgi:hypothetical protein